MRVAPLTNNGTKTSVRINRTHTLNILGGIRSQTSLAPWTGDIIVALTHIRLRRRIANEVGVDGEVKGRMSILTLISVRTKTTQVTPTENFFRVSVSTIGAVLAESPSIPRTIFDFQSWINMEKIALAVTGLTPQEGGEKMTNRHIFNIKEM